MFRDALDLFGHVAFIPRTHTPGAEVYVRLSSERQHEVIVLAAFVRRRRRPLLPAPSPPWSAMEDRATRWPTRYAYAAVVATPDRDARPVVVAGTEGRRDVLVHVPNLLKTGGLHRKPALKAS